MNRNPLEDLRRSNEEKYFSTREQDLLQALRGKAKRLSERQALGEATGLSHEGVLSELQDLGYSALTVELFYLVPLIQVAWADGSVTDEERDLIQSVARARNIQVGSEGDRQLSEWLQDRPSEEFFSRTGQIIGVLLTALGSGDRSDSANQLVALCADVASASGGFLGFGKVSAAEQRVIEEVAAHLGRDQAEAIAAVIARTREQ